MIEDENYEDLKNALIKLIENKDNRENMGKNGRRIYEEKFTAEIMANKFIDYYKNILKVKMRGNFVNSRKITETQ